MASIPGLSVPASSSTVDVRIIDSTAYGSAESSLFFGPEIPNHKTFKFPCHVFLVSHPVLNRHVLFDLGMMRDWPSRLPPETVELIQKEVPFTVSHEIQEILDADEGGIGIKSADVSSVIWSHQHYDHRGDVTKFPPTTEVVVGPGFQEAYAPYYPTDPESEILESELEGRQLREIDKSAFTQRVGGFSAYDFFGDGSFYLLDAPGHTTGHLCALARVTSSPEPTFVFMGGDCADHPGIFRPTPRLPLPAEVYPPLNWSGDIAMCPGAWIQQHIHPKKSTTEPFYEINPEAYEDPVQARESIAVMQEFDAADNILLCVAHDGSLLRGDLEFYPKKLNGWKARETQSKNQRTRIKWGFCFDFDLRPDPVLPSTK